VVHSAVEVLGGNGTIEEFSVLPRLYRDAMVYESWEGTHNVLVAQVLNDLRRLPILDVVSERLHRCLDNASDQALAAPVRSQLDRALGEARTCVTDHSFGEWNFRGILDQLGVLAETAYLLDAGVEWAATHLVLDQATPGYRPQEDSSLGERIDAVLASLG
jgi:acyl-CoA dehydrogenase